MPTSDEDLQKKQEHVEKLRQQLADEENKRVERETELSNDIAAGQLDAEAARLEAQLTAAKSANKVSAVKAGASAPIEAAKAEMATAVEQQKALAAADKTKES